MAADSPLNHGNNIENNYGTVHQYLGEPPTSKSPRGNTQRKRVALVGGIATALLGAWGMYAQSPAHAVGKKAYYCASGGHVKYHTSRACWGLNSCTARITTVTLARVKQWHMEPCQVCH
jgi:hypothetical protein